MPNPVTQAQTVEAVNAALAQLEPPGAAIADLDTGALSNVAWSCNNFSPAVLDQVCAITHTPVEDLTTTEYAQGAALPAAFGDATFVNISMMGEPSLLNHNVNILVSGGTTYLIQAFVGHQVSIVRRFPNAEFLTAWQNLSGNVDWTAAYAALTGVAPSAVVPEPPAATWLASQYVTL